MDENEDLVRVCAWCNRLIGPDNNAVGEVIPKNLQVGDKVTHGLCNACFAKQMEDLQGIK